MGSKFNKKRILISIALGFVIVGITYVIPSFSNIVCLPGIYLAALFWPEGIHSDMGIIGLAGFFSIIFLGSIFMWSALVYVSLCLLHRFAAKRYL